MIVDLVLCIDLSLFVKMGPGLRLSTWAKSLSELLNTGMFQERIRALLYNRTCWYSGRLLCMSNKTVCKIKLNVQSQNRSLPEYTCFVRLDYLFTRSRILLWNGFIFVVDVSRIDNVSLLVSRYLFIFILNKFTHCYRAWIIYWIYKQLKITCFWSCIILVYAHVSLTTCC